MKQYEIKVLIEALQNQINESEQMWDDKLPHAQIIGYLQGTIKGVISHLEGKIK